MKKSKRRKKSNSWRIKQHRDQFLKKSKTLGFRSRAAFKLIELNKNLILLKKIPICLILGLVLEAGHKYARKIITQVK